MLKLSRGSPPVPHEQPNSPPQDDLSQFLAPLAELARQPSRLHRFEDPPPDANLYPPLKDNLEIVESFRPDGTPTWWPLQRPHGLPAWSPEERRRVLLSQLAAKLRMGSPPSNWTHSDVQRLLNSLRHIAHALDSQEFAILA